MFSKQAILAIVAAMVFCVASSPAEASRASQEAIHDCKKEMERVNGADEFDDVSASDRDRGYKVSGYANQRGKNSQYFECWTEYGEVVDIDFDGWEESSSNGAKAVVAGVAIAAVIAAAVSAKHHHDDDADDYRYDDYGRDYNDRPDYWYPASGVTCYRNARTCYQNGSGYSAYWTRREFH